MGPKMFAVFMFAFVVMAYALFSDAGIKITQDGEILMALDIASLAGPTKWDEEATAEAGVIVLDVAEAEAEAQRYFDHNTRHLKTTQSILEVEVVNNAPVTRFVGGDILYFSSNGIIVSYDKFYQAVEVDDFLFEETEEEEVEDQVPEEDEEDNSSV